MTDHQVVSREEWTAAREDLRAREKEHTRLGDELARQRRELPWVRVEKEYRFDTDDGALPHLHARDVTMTYVSQAPLERLQAYKRRMGWNMPWVSSAASDFNFDLGYSRTEEQAREAIAPMLEAGAPPAVEQNARSSGTDATGYLTQGPGFSAFALEDGVVYQTYGTTARGLEFLMGYYGILDRAPRGRDEGDASQFWIRRHDEYRAG